ncbi:hypothetical protein FA13DRAFT_1727814 [Coprinellus micaceus]|uniref:PPP4R2-domain-containing protein n=1 Tax=Coprinellus micaceus TaxID=71717 RepID=A0A4Y7TPW7_COPMI|nr:hypothetical protein FA13DRAFT_1727814 [Coprinellus micaceus]
MSGWKKVNVRGKITHSPHFNSQAISGDLAITNTHIAATDDLKGSDWNELRQAVKQRLEENVKEYGTSTTAPVPPPFLPPFPAKKLSQLHMYDPPLSYMNEEQVKDALQAVFDQLDSFGRRLCELLLEPKRQYRSVGKYLRAVEKSILVTSSHDSFPIEPSSSSDISSAASNPNGNGHTPSRVYARISRSRSRSLSPTRAERDGTHPPNSPTPEPMTPLLLNSELPGRAVKLEEEGPVGLGMPGHTSENPKPLTIAAGAKPFLGSLQDRFVKAEASDDTKPKLEPKEAEDSKMDQDSESKP